MLRMTTLADNGHHVRLKLEGQVAGEWVAAFEEVCLSFLAQKKQVFLDCSDVTFIDRSGVAVLSRMLGERVHLLGASLLVKGLLGL